MSDPEAVNVPSAVVEYTFTDLGIPSVACQIIMIRHNFSVHGITAKMDGDHEEHQKVDDADAE